METNRNTYLNVNLENLKYNYNFYKTHTNKAIFSVVKANAYGLGAVKVAKTLLDLGSEYLGVATLDEALELRENDIMAPILVMGYSPVSSVKTAKKYNITLTVISLQWAQELNKIDISDLTLHIKLNSSMNRLGHNNFNEVIQTLNLLKHNHNIEGIFTHYCCNEKEIINQDFNNFKNIVNKLEHKFTWIHASNSYVSLKLEDNFTNSVRIGIGLYGGYQDLGLKNVASLFSEVAMIRIINNGDRVSYDGKYQANKKTNIAILTIGYADGVLRVDTGNDVYINNDYYKIVGNICMDQLMVKVDENVKLYDQVEIFGEHINIESIAKARDSIIYEVLTSISDRVTRFYK